MQIEQVLSERLRAVTELVTKGNRVADIGCDHAYTSIYLVEKGIAPCAIAMDINAGPIERAKENVALYGLTNKIVVRRSDGVKELEAEEADTLLITGMGGLLMKKILSDKPEVTNMAKELVLQPQSEVEELRRFLHSIGFVITKEQMRKEDGKFYVMFRAEKPCLQETLYEQLKYTVLQSGEYSREEKEILGLNKRKQSLEGGYHQTWTDLEYRYGAHLLKEHSAVFVEYLNWELQQKEQILANLEKIETEKARVRREQLVKEIEEVQQLLLSI